MELSIEVWALEEKHVGAVVLAIFPGMLRGSRKRVLTSWLQMLNTESRKRGMSFQFPWFDPCLTA